MVTLKNDSLSFTFRDPVGALKSHIESHIQSTLPDILETVRRERDLASHPGTYGSHLTNVFRSNRGKPEMFSPERVEAVFRDVCFERAGLQSADPHVEVLITFQRTLRIPDDGKLYPLPAGIGLFPLRHLDDFADRVPDGWKERGGVLMPMYQSEALWISFGGSYPVAIKVGAGKINAVTGE